MSCHICAPDLLADAQAREVARLLNERGDSVPGPAGRLLAAVEAYDLASSRLQWARATRVGAEPDQHRAITWHVQQRRGSREELLRRLRELTGVLSKQEC